MLASRITAVMAAMMISFLVRRDTTHRPLYFNDITGLGSAQVRPETNRQGKISGERMRPYRRHKPLADPMWIQNCTKGRLSGT
jgi:hypothetical protein